MQQGDAQERERDWGGGGGGGRKRSKMFCNILKLIPLYFYFFFL